MLLYVLKLLHDDGKTREHVTYRGANLPDMSRIGELTGLVCEMIFDRIADEKQIHLDKFYEPVIVDDNTYGAEISIVCDAFAELSEEFNELVRVCRSVLMYKMLAAYN